MEMQAITIEVFIQEDIAKVWRCFTEPQHVTQWNAASDDWHCPVAVNDLQPGGKFSYTMAAKDGSMSFDFEGVYDKITPHQVIAYTLGDGRKVKIMFEDAGDATIVTETFDPESENSIELQRAGWQAILNHFKQYTESL